MDERKMYLFRVSHPVHGEIEVEASDRYFAVTKAAHEWSLRWSTIARDCKVKQLGEVRRKRLEILPQAFPSVTTSPSAPRNDKRKGGSKNGKADKKKHRAN